MSSGVEKMPVSDSTAYTDDGILSNVFRDRKRGPEATIAVNDPVVFSDTGDMARKIHTRLADQIGRSIVRGDIQPGQSLPSELRICDMMNVSRTAVREALRVLVGKGLLLSRPKSGTKVRNPEHWNHLDPDILRWQFEIADVDSFLRKLFELRFAVEPAAASAAASARTSADADLIRGAFESMAAAESVEAYVEADILFHKRIYQATHNQFFWPIAQMFELALHQSFRITAPGDHRSRSIMEHRGLMEAIVARDPERAQATALQLLKSTVQDIVTLLGRDPFKAK
jgi:DNA-binding FadR family transcriptional regulator